MKLNKRGMSTIEIITSFALAFVIFVILFNVIISLKDIYMNSGTKTNILIEQANFNRRLNTNINSSSVISSIKLNRDNYSDNYNEYVIEFVDGNQSTLKIDKEKRQITFNDYVYNLSKTVDIDTSLDKYIIWTKIGDYVYNYYDNNSGLVVIDIPIKDKFLNEQFHLKAVYQYNSNKPVQIEL